MPTYDYECKSCGHQLESFHKMDEVLKECPQCKKESLAKQFLSSPFTIKKGEMPPPSKGGGCCPCGKKGSCH